MATDTQNKRGRPSHAEKLKQAEQELAELKAQMQLLTSSLAVSRNTSAAPQEDTVPIKRIGGGLLHVRVSDAYGRYKDIEWARVGEIQHLTKSQYDEMMDTPGAKSFFERGFLAVDGQEERGIADPGAYIAGLDLEEVDVVVGKITDPARLLRLLNHIEETRIVTTDENGKPLLDKEGFPMAEVKPLSAKYRIVAEAVTNRIYELTKVRYSLTDNG